MNCLLFRSNDRWLRGLEFREPALPIRARSSVRRWQRADRPGAVAARGAIRSRGPCGYLAWARNAAAGSSRWGPGPGGSWSHCRPLRPGCRAWRVTRTGRPAHAGFQSHSGVGIASHQHEKLERLRRNVSRPPVACERRALTASGDIRYTLKDPCRDGTTHHVLEPLDLMARLVDPVRPPTLRHVAMNWHGGSRACSASRSTAAPAAAASSRSSPASRIRGSPRLTVTDGATERPCQVRIGPEWLNRA